MRPIVHLMAPLPSAAWGLILLVAAAAVLGVLGTLASNLHFGTRIISVRRDALILRRDYEERLRKRYASRLEQAGIRLVESDAAAPESDEDEHIESF